MKINNIYDLAGSTLGLLESDSSNINYYLTNVNNVKYKAFTTYDDLFKGLDDNEVNMIIVPNVLNLNKTINSMYHVNYFFNNISKKIVLTLDGNNSSLNKIITKAYNKWFSKEYVKKYNEIYLNYYINMRQISDKTKADLLSKTYVYGYVENIPYEFSIAGNMEGIAMEYIKRIVRLTDIDITYNKYDTVEDLKKALDKGEVDIYFDYFNSENSKYLKTKSVFIENYAILGKDNLNYIDNLESLKGKNIATLSDNYLSNYLKNNTKANVIERKKVKDLNNDDLVVIDKEVYSYYKTKEFQNYVFLFSVLMTSD